MLNPKKSALTGAKILWHGYNVTDRIVIIEKDIYIHITRRRHNSQYFRRVGALPSPALRFRELAMKTIAYGMLVGNQLVLNTMSFSEDTAFEKAHHEHYSRFYKDDVKLVKCEIEYEIIKQISQPKSKKRKKLKRKRLKLR